MRDGLHPPVVITPLHPHEGSVLGRIVAGQSCLELLVNINRVVAITRTLEEVRAKLAALRCVSIKEKCKHGLLSIWCAICTKHNDGGLVDARGTANRYLTNKRTKKDPPAHEAWSAEAVAKLRKILDSKPNPRTITALELNQIRMEERERLEWLRLNNVQTGLPAPPKNYSPELKMYVQENDQPRIGSASSCCATLVKQNVRRNAEVLHDARRFQKPVAPPIATPQRKRYSLVPWMASIFHAARTMRDLSKMEDVDSYEIVMGDLRNTDSYVDAVRHLKARSRWLTEMHMEYKGGPEARSFNSILSESRLFPN